MTDRVRVSLEAVAAEHPERPAILSPAGDRTFAELNARANQLARALRRIGLGTGDSVALLCSNRPEFAEVMFAALRSGLRYTPINWHLAADEVAYIVDDCEAKAFVADVRFAAVATDVARLASSRPALLAIGGDIDGFDSYDSAVADEDSANLEDPAVGQSMLYTSGTTGRPKGVYRHRPREVPLSGPEVYAEPATDVHLCTGPAYHAAPLGISVHTPLWNGVTVVMMDGWEPEENLRLIEAHRVTHTHMVPTMFHRLLALPDDVRTKYDLSSLKLVVHGAAPCPPHVKQALIGWFGPVVVEYYAGTEGGGTLITAQEWLERPGSVGRPGPTQAIEIRDDAGEPVAAGTVGTVYMKAPDKGAFVYFKDPDKTSRTYKGRWFTLGDMGYVDDDGYLFLTGRSAEVIISGGVNIYPAEVDAVLLMHPSVADVATVGVPNEEWGEEVKAVVEVKDGAEPSEVLADELLAFARDRLARYKCPRTVDFDDALPRHDTGKIYRRLVRERYWQGRERSI